MKKNYSKSLIAFIMGAILFSGIAIVSAYSLTADSVSYTPKDSTWDINNTGSALNYLYNNYKTITDPSVDIIYLCSGENTNTCSGTSLEIGKYYFCVVNTRNYNSSQTITGAEVFYNREQSSYLDYKYSTYRSFIKPTSSSVTFTIGNGRGILVTCYHVISGE